MKAKISLLAEFLKLSAKQSTIYRGTWFLGVIAQFLKYGASILSLYIVILSLGEVRGWTAPEMMFIYALSLLSYAIAASIFYGPCMMLGSKVLNGDLDQTLTRPMGVLAYEIVSNFNIGYVSHISLGIVLTVVALYRMSLKITWMTIVILIVIIICGALIQSSMLLLSSMFCFILVSGNPLLSFIVFQAGNFIHYPVNIYPLGVQLILTFILPYAFINFYPVVNLLNKQELAFGGSILGNLFPVVAIVLFLFSVAAWNYSLRFYNSSGA